MERERIKRMGSQPMNGNDAFAVLGIVFDWIEETELKTPLLEPNTGNTDELRELLQQAGYFFK